MFTLFSFRGSTLVTINNKYYLSVYWNYSNRWHLKIKNKCQGLGPSGRIAPSLACPECIQCLNFTVFIPSSELKFILKYEHITLKIIFDSLSNILWLGAISFEERKGGDTETRVYIGGDQTWVQWLLDQISVYYMVAFLGINLIIW